MKYENANRGLLLTPSWSIASTTTVVLEFHRGSTGVSPWWYWRCSLRLKKILLVSGENPEHFNLCAYYSAFLTKSRLRGLAQSLEETTDHRRGRKPPVGLRQQKKPRRGDRVLNMLFANQLDVLSPLRGFCFVDVPEPGVGTPVCVLSHLDLRRPLVRCFSPDTNKKI